MLGERILRFESELIVIASRLAVQEAADAREVGERLAQVGGGIGRAQSGAIGFAQLLEPAEELIIAQAARSFLDVRLEMIDWVREFGVAVARQVREIADERVAVAVDEARQLASEIRVESTVTGEEALIEKADVQLGVLVVHLE